VGHRAGLDTEARGKILSTLPGIEPRSPDRPARSRTLYGHVCTRSYFIVVSCYVNVCLGICVPSY
jgi:hypothetical protein